MSRRRERSTGVDEEGVAGLLTRRRGVSYIFSGRARSG
jgi:hypothetical protein